MQAMRRLRCQGVIPQESLRHLVHCPLTAAVRKMAGLHHLAKDWDIKSFMLTRKLEQQDVILMGKFLFTMYSTFNSIGSSANAAGSLDNWLKRAKITFEDIDGHSDGSTDNRRSSSLPLADSSMG